MTDLNDFFYTDGVQDVLALYINKLVSGNLRGELTNVQTLGADKTLTDADFPSQFLDAGGADRIVKTPAKATTNHEFFFAHTGAANTITVKNSDASVTLGVLAAGEVMLAVSGGAGKEYKAIKTVDLSSLSTSLSNYLLKSGLTEWDQQGSDPSNPASSKWKLYFKSGGLYFINSSGTVVGPIGSGSGDLVSPLTAAEISITGATTLTINRYHVISGSSNYTVALPAASGNTGKFIGGRITNTGITTIDPNASETIDTVLTKRYFQGQSFLLKCDGSNWMDVLTPVAPRECAVFADGVIPSSTLTSLLDLSQKFTLFLYPAASTNGATIKIPLFLAAGSYTLTMLGLTATDAGIFDWDLNGTSQTTGQDWYSSPNVYNVEKSFTMTVPYTGYHLLTATVNGKNAVSGGYRYYITKFKAIPAVY